MTRALPFPDDPLLEPLELGAHDSMLQLVGFGPVVTQLLLFCTQPRDSRSEPRRRVPPRRRLQAPTTAGIEPPRGGSAHVELHLHACCSNTPVLLTLQRHRTR
jgi:hypothetical protein